MAEFSYKARKSSGEVVTGVINVTDRGAALLHLQRTGLFPVSLEARNEGGRTSASRRRNDSPLASLPTLMRGWIQQQRKPKLQELATYTQQLANLLHSGMPLAVALNSMGHLQSRGIPPEVSQQLRKDVMEGRNLSDAMAQQNHVFSPLYVNMVRAGEQSGALEEVLFRLAAHFKMFAEVRQKFVTALTYPLIVAAVGIAIIVVFMTVILPRFTSIFTEMDIPLPGSTQALVSITGFFSDWWFLFPLAPVLLVIAYRRYAATPSGRQSIDRWKISLPVLGNVVRLNLFGQFARTLSTLLENGVPMLTALQITQKVLPNVILQEAIAGTREGVTDGKTLAQPLARCHLFPQLMIDLIKIGEETGDVPGSLRSLAETYENELTIALGVMKNLIEPAMILVMAIGVGGLLFSILSAMFQVTSSLGG